jgi:hypothetical protein
MPCHCKPLFEGVLLWCGRKRRTNAAGLLFPIPNGIMIAEQIGFL